MIALALIVALSALFGWLLRGPGRPAISDSAYLADCRAWARIYLQSCIHDAVRHHKPVAGLYVALRRLPHQDLGQ